MYKKGDLIAYKCGRDLKKGLVYKVGLFLEELDSHDEKADWGLFGLLLTEHQLQKIWLHGSSKISDS